MSVKNCHLIKLPKFSDLRGNLSVVEGGQTIPFEIKRSFYMYNIAFNESRGEHAHKTLEQFLMVMSGSFRVKLNDGINVKTYSMIHPHIGLYICPKMWVRIFDFSAGAVCMVLASDHYDEHDYIRDYQEFLRIVKGE
jgi:hypothetical protein